MLPKAVARRPVHQRNIICQGYLRDDGLWDIEGQLCDTKSYSFRNHDRGLIAAGEPLHNMTVRLTLDDHYTIIAAIAHTSHAPYRLCPAISDAYQALVGLKIAAGFSRALRQRLGGIQGCTHLSEIVRILATVAFQTIRTDSKDFLHQATAEDIAPSNNSALPKGLQGTCHAFAPNTEVSKRVFDDTPPA